MTDSDPSRRWTLITVTYNSASHLRSSWNAGPPGDVRWLVVDNNSTDDTLAVANGLGAEVIALDRNIGFSAANNLGLERTESEWIAFVNPDVTVGGVEDLERLARIASANAGFVAPQLLNTDGSEQPNARGLPYPLSKLAHRSLRLPWMDVELDDYARTGFNAPVYVAWVMGAALAGTTEDFRSIGGWNERFFLYYEDHDIGLRSWRAGKPVVVDPSVRWAHGWQRETTQMRIQPWLHELRSASTFYRQWPALVSRKRARKSPLLNQIQRSVWCLAQDS